MCSIIDSSCGTSNPYFFQDQGKSVIIVAIALTFITLSALSAQRRIPLGSVGAQVLSTIGSIILLCSVINCVDTSCHTTPKSK